MRFCLALYTAVAAATLLVAQAQQQIPLNCPANYEKISCDTCQCKAQPDVPCPGGGSWDPDRCECRNHPAMPEDMPEAMLPIVCQRTCPLGTTIRQDCECHTDDCMSLSAKDCESVKCGADAYCGLGSKTSSSAPDEPPRVFCSGCGCCSTARLEDDLHLMMQLEQGDMSALASRNSGECTGSPCENIQGP